MYYTMDTPHRKRCCIAARWKAAPPKKGELGPQELREALLSLEYRWERKVLTIPCWNCWCNKGLKAYLFAFTFLTPLHLHYMVSVTIGWLDKQGIAS